MSNPELKTLPVGTWVKVATAVTNGAIYRKNLAKMYQTIRPTGEAAPSSAVADSEQVEIFLDNPDEEQISSYAQIDVYLKASDYDGKIRIDV